MNTLKLSSTYDAILMKEKKSSVNSLTKNDISSYLKKFSIVENVIVTQWVKTLASSKLRLAEQ